MTTLYFAYGSNLSLDMMTTTCGKDGFETIGGVALSGYRLAFNRESLRWGHGVADIVEASERVVWGALYRVGVDCLSQLDKKETLGKGYRYLHIAVTDRDGHNYDALTYTVIDKLAQDIAPSSAYLHTILTGAREHQLPADYIAWLESIRTATD